MARVVLSVLLAGVFYTAWMVVAIPIIKNSFWKAYKWFLISCAIGGGIVSIFGQMLIVFGMFVAGTLSVVVHEVIIKGNHKKTEKAKEWQTKLPKAENIRK